MAGLIGFNLGAAFVWLATGYPLSALAHLLPLAAALALLSVR